MSWKMKTTKMFVFSLLLTIFVQEAASFWGEDVTPRLRVNYLSQSNGKNDILQEYLINLSVLKLKF